jgi:hypothetical protein
VAGEIDLQAVPSRALLPRHGNTDLRMFPTVQPAQQKAARLTASGFFIA